MTHFLSNAGVFMKIETSHNLSLKKICQHVNFSPQRTRTRLKIVFNMFELNLGEPPR